MWREGGGSALLGGVEPSPSQATLQQEGLLSHYKQQRLLAVLPPLDKGGSVRPSPRPAGPSAPAPPAAALGPRAATKGSGLSGKEQMVCGGGGALLEPLPQILQCMSLVLCDPLFTSAMDPRTSSLNPPPPGAALLLCTGPHGLLLSGSIPWSFPESLSVLLDDLHSLSEAISKEEAVSQGDNQNSLAARGSECLRAQGGPAGQEDREMG